MRNIIIVGTLILTFFLASCGSAQENNSLTAELDEFTVLNTTDEETEGDFIYRIVTEKGEYRNNETVNIYSELEYIGDKEGVTIYHAASPFNFPMVEKTRGFEIGYPMNEPLRNTTLIKGEPLREEYGRSGGYGSQDESDYVEFMTSFLNDGFLPGYYVVIGYVDFYVENKEDDKKDYRIKGKIDFKVTENN
ncbi:hypothetical protein [Aquibacillus albus]|uniref:Uncharacterized protein n=1 Tax=Aquibacillus albus TaxID=1168171 RepID=A0ABS2N6I9_9BACI|nr:hypothetical protein [Aquibacillus albus]MBM7573668.1 hypothetical protein [Aquibacillus albus]